MSINTPTSIPNTNTTSEPLPKLPTAAPAVLEVIDGVHQGVTLPLDKTVYSIGSKPSADIILGDGGVAAEHGVIRLQGRLVIVEAAGGDIGLGKHHRIAQGHGCRTALPVELRIGSAVLRIAPAAMDGRSWLGSQSALRLAAVGGIGCIVLIPISGLGTGRLSTAPSLQSTDAASPGDSTTTVGTAGGRGAPRTQTASAVSAEAVADALTAKLGAAGLRDIRTTMNGTRVLASGAILHEQRDAWSEVQRWFDRTYAGRYILASTVEVRIPSGNPKFDLQAISFSETPYVITADGQRRYPGAVLDKGWVIKEIGERRLTLTKDGKDLALDF